MGRRWTAEKGDLNHLARKAPYKPEAGKPPIRRLRKTDGRGGKNTNDNPQGQGLLANLYMRRLVLGGRGEVWRRWLPS